MCPPGSFSSIFYCFLCAPLSLPIIDTVTYADTKPTKFNLFKGEFTNGMAPTISGD